MKKDTTIFDIIGPEIVGPSSSHTAGACRIGLMARKIYGPFDQLKKIHYVLYNSFAKTGKGHGTDKGILGGTLGIKVNDILLKDAFSIAKKNNINVSFDCKDDFSRHPNSVDIIFNDNELFISANSIGGGEIEVIKINESECCLYGDLPTLILNYKDKPGMVANVTNIILNKSINIANMVCNRSSKGEVAYMSISLDSQLSDDIIDEIKKIDEIYTLRYIEALDR